MKAELELPKVPQGWVYDGFRQIEKGERYFDGKHWAEWIGGTSNFLAFVLKSTWRPATAADVGKTCRCIHNGKAYEGKLVHVYDRRVTPHLCVIRDWHTTFQYCEVLETDEQVAETENPATQNPPVTLKKDTRYVKVLRKCPHDFWDDEGRRYWWIPAMDKYIGGVHEALPGNLVCRIDGLVFPREVLQKVEVFPIGNQEGLWYFLSCDDVTKAGDLEYIMGKWSFPSPGHRVEGILARRVK